MTSDHGEEFFEHEEFGHGYSLYGEVTRIPAALHTGGGQGDVDVALEGRDLFDLLRRASRSKLDVPAWAAARHRDERYASIYYSSEGRLLLRPYLAKVCQRSVEAEGYKLVWSAYGETVELYDLAADAGEQRNLAAVRPDVVARLLPMLDDAVRFWSFPGTYERSPAELQQLRDLGYLD